MPNGAQPGYLVVVKIGATPAVITGVKSVDIKIGSDIYDITAFSDGQWKKKIGGLSDYTISFSGNLDMSDTQQQALQAAMITTPGAQVPWQVLPQGGASPKYSGTAICKAESLKFAVGAEQQVQFDAEGTGAITYA